MDIESSEPFERNRHLLPEEIKAKEDFDKLIARAYDLGYRQVVHKHAAGWSKGNIIFNLSGVWQTVLRSNRWTFDHVLDTRDINKIAEYLGLNKDK